MNCHECKFVGSVVGSAHKSCKVLQSTGDSDSKLLELMIIGGQCDLLYEDKDGAEKKCVDLDPHGVKNGWAIWPIAFDPVWINSCVFFTKKEKNEKISNETTILPTQE